MDLHGVYLFYAEVSQQRRSGAALGFGVGICGSFLAQLINSTIYRTFTYNSKVSAIMTSIENI